MADINGLYGSLLAADEAGDAAALAALAWQMYGQLATTAADLAALRARFRVYAAAPHAQRQAVGPTGSPDRRLRGGGVAGRRATPEMSSTMGKLTAAAPVPVGTVEPPAPCARPSGNGQGQDIAAF